MAGAGIHSFAKLSAQMCQADLGNPLPDTVPVMGPISNSETVPDPVPDPVPDLDTVPDPVIVTYTQTSSFPL
jgi:hypothetical protein